MSCVHILFYFINCAKNKQPIRDNPPHRFGPVQRLADGRCAAHASHLTSDTPLLERGWGQQISSSCRRTLLFVEDEHVCPLERKRSQKRANHQPPHCYSPSLCVFYGVEQWWNYHPHEHRHTNTPTHTHSASYLNDPSLSLRLEFRMWKGGVY